MNIFSDTAYVNKYIKVQKNHYHYSYIIEISDELWNLKSNSSWYFTHLFKQSITEHYISIEN